MSSLPALTLLGAPLVALWAAGHRGSLRARLLALHAPVLLACETRSGHAAVALGCGQDVAAVQLAPRSAPRSRLLQKVRPLGTPRGARPFLRPSTPTSYVHTPPLCL